MKKRILAFFLALCVLFCAMITFAEDFDDEDFDDDFGDDFSDEDFGDGETTFEEEEGKVDFRTIAGYDTEKLICGDYVYQMTEDRTAAVIVSYSGTDQNVVVPDTLDDYPVVAIGDFAFNYQQGIETVTLPQGIVSLGNMSFFQCENLKSIIIPDGVVKIDQNCFGGCKGLEEVVIPDTVTEIGTFGFLACMKLTEVRLGSGIRDIGSGAFRLCSSLTKVTIPGGDVVRIADDSFVDCSPGLEIIRE